MPDQPLDPQTPQGSNAPAGITTHPHGRQETHHQHTGDRSSQSHHGGHGEDHGGHGGHVAMFRRLFW